MADIKSDLIAKNHKLRQELAKSLKSADGDEPEVKDELEPAPVVEDEKKDEAPADTDADNIYVNAGKILDGCNDISMCYLEAADGSDAAWIIIADFDPIARIKLSSLGNDEDYSEFFSLDKYRDSIIDAGKENGFANILKEANADIISDKNIVKVESNKVDITSVNRDYLNRFTRAMDITADAMIKNIEKTPLKESFYSVLSDASMRNATPCQKIETAFGESFVPTVKALISKAMEWMNFDDKAMVEIQAFINSANSRDLEKEEEIQKIRSSQEEDVGDGYRQQLARNNMTLRNV